MELKDYPKDTIIIIADREFSRLHYGSFWREIHSVPGNCVSRPSASLTNIEESTGVVHVVKKMGEALPEQEGSKSRPAKKRARAGM